MKYYETATIAQTQKRLKEEGHNISVCTLRGWVRTGVTRCTYREKGAGVLSKCH